MLPNKATVQIVCSFAEADLNHALLKVVSATVCFPTVCPQPCQKIYLPLHCILVSLSSCTGVPLRFCIVLWLFGSDFTGIAQGYPKVFFPQTSFIFIFRFR
ncbi:UNVERIFIED_CONTAM: hypothetical protein K2H54_035514 [Gekko kuhli]